MQNDVAIEQLIFSAVILKRNAGIELNRQLVSAMKDRDAYREILHSLNLEIEGINPTDEIS